MPDIEISEECRALIAVEFEIDETARRLPNGNWQVPIDEKTWRRLQKLRGYATSRFPNASSASQSSPTSSAACYRQRGGVRIDERLLVRRLEGIFPRTENYPDCYHDRHEPNHHYSELGPKAPYGAWNLDCAHGVSLRTRSKVQDKAAVSG
jgi:hypothetical protein